MQNAILKGNPDKGHQGRFGDFIPPFTASAAANRILAMALVCGQELTRNNTSTRHPPPTLKTEKVPRMRVALTFTMCVTVGKILYFSSL